MDECPYGAGECPKLTEMKADIKTLESKVDAMDSSVTTLSTKISYMTTILSVLMVAVFGVSLI